MAESLLDESGDEDLLGPPAKKKRAQVVRHKWTLEEQAELRELFHVNFQNKKCPRYRDCLDAIKTSKSNNGLVCKIGNWETIKKKVAHMLDKV